MNERDYKLPDMVDFPEEEDRPVGEYGRRYQNYLQRHHKALCFSMRVLGCLNAYLAHMDEEAEARFEAHLSELRRRQGLNDELYRRDPALWAALNESAEREARMLTRRDFRWMEE